MMLKIWQLKGYYFQNNNHNMKNNDCYNVLKIYDFFFAIETFYALKYLKSQYDELI